MDKLFFLLRRENLVLPSISVIGTQSKHRKSFLNAYGENDCNKGEDEKNCSVPSDVYVPQEVYTLPSPDTIQGCDEYTCKNGKCIPQSYVCDGENDCNNGEDEKGCCVDECDYSGQVGCDGTSVKECGNGRNAFYNPNFSTNSLVLNTSTFDCSFKTFSPDQRPQFNHRATAK